MSSNWDDNGTTGHDETVPEPTDTLAGEEHAPPTLSRPKGPSWGTVALGLVCLVIAGGALFIELTEVDLDWTSFGPLTLVGLGVLLVLVGLAALVRRNEDEELPR